MLVLGSLTLLAVGGCDSDDQLDPPSAAVELQASAIDIDWDAVALPQALVGTHDIGAASEPAVPVSDPNGAQYSLETFRFYRSDAFAVTMATGGLFAQTPANIEPFDEAPNDTSLFVGMSLRDEQGDVIGYGSEQHVIDYEALDGQGTFTLTIPGRGTLMLAHHEDPSFVLDEVSDMLANNEPVRSYDTPMVFQSTVPDTGQIIGGTGEFADAMGMWREIDAIHEFDLVTLEHTFEVFVQVALLPNQGNGD